MEDKCMSEESRLVGKIKKLLALAGNNSNQEEAKQALLKAQQLMAENNIDVSFDNTDEPVAYSMELAVTKMNKAFRLSLAGIIASNFRCRAFILGNKENTPIGFFGHEQDAKICKEAFEFAYNTAKRNGDLEYKRCKNAGLETRNVFNSYVTGYIQGIQMALAAQCTALMVIVPKDVITEADNRFHGKPSNRSMVNNKSVGLNFEAVQKGIKDGKENFTKRAIEK